MSRYSEIWRIMVTLDTGYPILINFRQVRLKSLRTTFDASQWHILLNIASTGPVWPVVGYGVQLWSRISSLNEIEHIKAELRDLGLVHQVIAYTALWDKIGQISSKVAYNGPVTVTVSRYDRLGPYLSLHYLFWTVLALYVIFDHVTINEPRKRECDQKWSIMIHNDLSYRGVTNCGHISHSIANSGQFSTSATEKATYDLWRQLVAYTA